MLIALVVIAVSLARCRWRLLCSESASSEMQTLTDGR